MGLARQHAQRLGHDYIGPEHMLFGLIDAGGSAYDVLRSLDVDLGALGADVERRTKPGTNPVAVGQLPFTAGGKRVLELCLKEASSLGHNYMGTEHLLLALCRCSDSIAAQALRKFGVALDRATDEARALIGDEVGSQEPSLDEIGRVVLVLANGDASRVTRLVEERGWSCLVVDIAKRGLHHLKYDVRKARFVIALAEEADPLMTFAIGVAFGMGIYVVAVAPTRFADPLGDIPTVSMEELPAILDRSMSG